MPEIRLIPVDLIDPHPHNPRRDLAADCDALRSMHSGRCLSDITHRDEGHRQSVCMLPVGHAPLAHDDCMGCTWTDAYHWEPSAIDALAAQVERVRALHRPRTIQVLGAACSAEVCDHDDCPLVDYTVCDCCYAVGDGASIYAYENGGIQDVAHPCPTIRALDGEADR